MEQDVQALQLSTAEERPSGREIHTFHWSNHMKFQTGDEVSQGTEVLDGGSSIGGAQASSTQTAPETRKPSRSWEVCRKIIGCPLASRGTIELQKHKNPTLGWVAGGKLYRTTSQSLNSSFNIAHLQGFGHVFRGLFHGCFQ